MDAPGSKEPGHTERSAIYTVLETLSTFAQTLSDLESSDNPTASKNRTFDHRE